jgi:hypothetical protein
MPPEIYLAELILAYVLTRNMNMFFYMYTFPYTFEEWVTCSFMMILIVITSILAINTMIGMPSSQRYSWRSSVRSIIFQILVTVVYYVMDLVYFFINPWVLLLLMSITLVIMFLPRVRRYHTPPLREVPPLKEWVKFVFFRPDETVYEYRFVYARRK